MTEAHRALYEEEAMSYGLSFYGDTDNFLVQKDMFTGEYVVYVWKNK